MSSSAEKKPPKKTTHTPMMEQYFAIKAENPGFLLFYRMGDFYELFFEDAVVASKVLDIALTARGKSNGEDIPMCGVPVHAAEDYLQRLIAADYRIAVCEQMEDPAKARARGAKAVVRREVVRLVTPGTLTEEKLLAPGRANYLMALVRCHKKPYQKTSPEHPQSDFFTPNEENSEHIPHPHYAFAWIDISTGEFQVSTCDSKKLLAEILQIEPQELIIADSLYSDEQLRPMLDIVGKPISPQADSLFSASMAEKRVCNYYNVATLEGFANFSQDELRATSAILAYVEKTQIHEKPQLARPTRKEGSQYLFIDAATTINLELVRTLSGKTDGSLIKTIDRTLTGSGARLLAERLTAPLSQVEQIQQRQDAIAFFLNEQQLCFDLRAHLKGLADIMRALSRLALGRGGPRDFAAILQALDAAKSIRHLLAFAKLPQELHKALENLEYLPEDWRQKLKAALADELPLLKRDGGFIRKGYHNELDELRTLKSETHRVIASMQNALAEETGVKNLKIKHNNILGFFIEVTTAQATPLMDSPEAKARFIHRQSMANAMRFTTTELADLENKISSASQGALAIELQIFEELTQDIKNYADDLREGAKALAILDVATALAVLADEQNYTRPVVDTSLELNIKGGRHPVVEQALRKQNADPFIANDCNLSPIPENETSKDKAGSIWLLTGPNMGGKSTFLRQNALIVLLAQMGSFVPAKTAHIGLVDRLFSRVGASDDLAQGRSTFMVEMVETATILNQAGSRSLVILDEIGRGTATFDGLSIAWAALEYLHNSNKCRAIFATHFHELTVLSQNLARLSNHTMTVREWHGEVIFLHEVREGAADRSYGVQVAKLAGLPEAVINRARSVLEQLESRSLTGQTADILHDLPLFGHQDLPHQQTQLSTTRTPESLKETTSKESNLARMQPASPINSPTTNNDIPAPFKDAVEKASLNQINTNNYDEAPQAAQVVMVQETKDSPLYQALDQIDPDSLTPRAALEELYRLKEILAKN